MGDKNNSICFLIKKRNQKIINKFKIISNDLGFN
jgi:hypothetical protein